MGRLLPRRIRRFLRPALKASAVAILLSGAAAPPDARAAQVYDPEVALLALETQQASVRLLAAELRRRAAASGRGELAVLFSRFLEPAARSVESSLRPDGDVLEDLRRSLVSYNPADAAAIGRLVEDIRRRHGLAPGPALERFEPPRRAARPRLAAQNGYGTDVETALEGTLPAGGLEAAEAAIGAAVAFLRQRRWDVDFYFGPFADLAPHYRKLGFRSFYRLRAPQLSRGRQAFVLSPEPNLRPRLVFCAFAGRDLFLHVRAQHAALDQAAGKGPIVRLLRSASGSELSDVKALRALAGSVPYRPDVVLMGWTSLLSRSLAARHLGTYENDAWRMDVYSLPKGVAASLESRRTDFGEIPAAALDVLLGRGVRKVFYAGPAAALDERLPAGRLLAPRRLLASDGSVRELPNILPLPEAGAHGGVSSPLLLTREWAEAARARGAVTADGQAAAVAERVASFNAGRARPVELGLALLTVPVSGLQAEDGPGPEPLFAKPTRRQRKSGVYLYRNEVLKLLGL